MRRLALVPHLRALARSAFALSCRKVVARQPCWPAAWIYLAPLPKEEILKLRIALFHDNFAQMGGAERVTEVLYETLPGADLFSTLSVPERLSPTLREAGVRNTWMQRLPARAKLFRAYFLLYPFAIDGADMSPYDLVVTSCFGYAKGVRKRPGALHICYSYTPMRWVWRTDDYLSREKTPASRPSSSPCPCAGSSVGSSAPPASPTTTSPAPTASPSASAMPSG